jgi:hypothetical protein
MVHAEEHQGLANDINYASSNGMVVTSIMVCQGTEAIKKRDLGELQGRSMWFAG